ncbi:hypothetical protein Scep_006133 [Stephania cephalantha]|uniref:Uncharacterized protein n=1 Tax=Stephania cephalantha TaxID=152367 RepID=A0AAP0K7F6_9MAGN
MGLMFRCIPIYVARMLPRHILRGGNRWCVHCLEVTEEPGLSREEPGSSRRSPLVTEEPKLVAEEPDLQSKMGVWPWRVWPWASMALGGYGLGGSGGEPASFSGGEPSRGIIGTTDDRFSSDVEARMAWRFQEVATTAPDAMRKRPDSDDAARIDALRRARAAGHQCGGRERRRSGGRGVAAWLGDDRTTAMVAGARRANVGESETLEWLGVAMRRRS